MPFLDYVEVSDETWDTILDEGLNEEFSLERDSFFEAILDIPRKYKDGLIIFDEDVLNFFNNFDYELKSEYRMNFIDFIDYEKGIVKIIKILHKVKGNL